MHTFIQSSYQRVRSDLTLQYSFLPFYNRNNTIFDFTLRQDCWDPTRQLCPHVPPSTTTPTVPIGVEVMITLSFHFRSAASRSTKNQWDTTTVSYSHCRIRTFGLSYSLALLSFSFACCTKEPVQSNRTISLLRELYGLISAEVGGLQ